MTKKALLKRVDSYHGIFTELSNELKTKSKAIDCKNLIFCEEKVSLTVERSICAALGGTFNTEVYSFGKFLRSKKPQDRILTKEGSSMVLRRIIHGLELKCFSQNKASLASSLYDLLILLKSASLTVEDVKTAAEKTDGVLKNKLVDVALIFDAYEKFVSDNGFADQSTALSLLPNIINGDAGIRESDVYLVGYTGWTKQAREIVSALLNTAKSVTAILPSGENKQLFVNETADMFKRLCQENGVSFSEKNIVSDRVEEGKIISRTVFSPLSYRSGKINTDRILFTDSPTVYEEVNRVAQTVKASVMQKGLKYSDILVAVPNIKKYADTIKTCFATLEIPCFVDEEKTVVFHPLVRLVAAYQEAIRKKYERNAFLAFVKNPLFCSDKKFVDAFENYLIKYNINFDKIKNPFTVDEIDLEKANAFRERALAALELRNEIKMLEFLNVRESIDELTAKLKSLNMFEDAGINDQIYDAVTGVLNDVDVLLSDTPLTVKERKDLFLSGAIALKLSIIPQYTDAVFVGEYKEACLTAPKYTFMLGLTDEVPCAREDVSILTDGELERLENIKVLVEPKISIINKRETEYVGTTLSSFGEKLFLSCPLTSDDGKSTVKSEIIDYVQKLFTVKKYVYKTDCLTFKQTMLRFAKECGEFAECKTDSNALATAFYSVVKENPNLFGDKSHIPEKILQTANKELKIRLDGNVNILRENTVSPTTIESFYKCPYNAFLSRTLKISERENGEVSPVSVGNIAHRIFEIFVSFIERFPDADEETAFNYALDKIKADIRFSKYIDDVEEKHIFLRTTEESRIYCRKLYALGKNSLFRPVGYEEEFGDGKKYPAIPLHGGKYKISGKIDRIDVYDDYFRVIDYKTGRYDVSEEALFTGTALQLYLYSAAVRQMNGKRPAGMYYFPVDEGYKAKDNLQEFVAEGKTLGDVEVLKAQDKNFIETNKAFGVTFYKNGSVKGASTNDTIGAHIDYALKMCENATEQMSSGVIAQTPFKSICNNCVYKGMCDFQDAFARTVKKIDESVINAAIGKQKEIVDDRT